MSDAFEITEPGRYRLVREVEPVEDKFKRRTLWKHKDTGVAFRINEEGFLEYRSPSCNRWLRSDHDKVKREFRNLEWWACLVPRERMEFDEPPFKEGDEVRVVRRHGGLEVGEGGTVKSVYWNGAHEHWHVRCLEATGTTIAADADCYELVPPQGKPAPAFKVGDWVQPEDRRMWERGNSDLRCLLIEEITDGGRCVLGIDQDGEGRERWGNKWEPYAPEPGESVVVTMDRPWKGSCRRRVIWSEDFPECSECGSRLEFGAIKSIEPDVEGDEAWAIQRGTSSRR